MLARLVRDVIAQTWAERAQAELSASNRFGRLAQRLRRFDTHQKIVDLVAQAEEDEERHAGLCARMAMDYGHGSGFAVLSHAESEHLPTWHQNRHEQNKLLLDIVSLCCITESINASLLNSIYVRAMPSGTRQVIQAIFRDEVKHAQIGWAYLTEQSRRRDCGFVGDYLHEMLELAVRDELFSPMVGRLG